MKKKITHIIIGLNVGGAELMLQRLVFNSSKKGQFEHLVISLTDLGVIGPKLQQEGIKVFTLNIHSLATMPLGLIKLRKLLKEIKPDVVQTWMYHADLLGGMVAKSLGIDNIIWGVRRSQPYDKHSNMKTLFRKVCASTSTYIPSKIVCVAHMAKKNHALFGYNLDKMIVIPNGFDLSYFYPDRKKKYILRSSLNIEDNDLLIGNIGRFTPEKNHINFIKACITLMNKGYVFKVLFAGRDINLSNPKISKLLLNSEFRSNFIFLGEISDTSYFYNAIDIFCLCSYTEGFPNVLGEAMATGNVCLSTDAGDAKLILNNYGFNIEGSDSHNIASSIEENIFNTSKAELQDIGLKARNSIQERYAIEGVVSAFEELYKD